MKARRYIPSGRGGFSLVEVMIAVSILAGISAVMGLSMNAMFSTRDYFEERYERFQIARNALNRMSAEVASAYMAGPEHGGEPIPGEEPDARSGGEEDQAEVERLQREPVQFGFIGRDDSMNFTSFAHLRTQDGERNGHHAEIGYFLRREQDEDTGRTVERLMRREDTTYDSDITKGGTIYVMIPEVKDVEFEYWDSGQVRQGTAEEIAQGRWVSEWDTTRTEFAGRLPTRVRMKVTLPPQSERSRDDVFVTQAQLGVTEVLEF